MHTHNLFEVIYMLKGDVTHIIEDRKYKLKKHDLVLIPPSKYHFIQVDKPCEYVRYNFLFSVEEFGFDKIEEFNNLRDTKS